MEVHTLYTPPVTPIRETYIFFNYIFSLVNYCTYGFIASRLCVNYLPHFLLHQIWVIRLFNVRVSSGLVTSRYETLWRLLVSFLLIYFEPHIFCFNVFQMFMLLQEQCVRICIIILFLQFPMISHSSAVFRTFCM